MNSDWKFKVAFCLIASIYVIGINCDGRKDRGSTGETFKFSANHTMANNESQINCGPKELCDKAKIQNVTCTGNITAPIANKTSTVDYTCSSDVKLEDLKLEWSYAIFCLPHEKDVINKNCGVNITLKEAPASGGGSSHIALIIGIVVLVIAVLIGVVVLLGYKGIGPLKSFFNN